MDLSTGDQFEAIFNFGRSSEWPQIRVFWYIQDPRRRTQTYLRYVRVSRRQIQTYFQHLQDSRRCIWTYFQYLQAPMLLIHAHIHILLFARAQIQDLSKKYYADLYSNAMGLYIICEHSAFPIFWDTFPDVPLELHACRPEGYARQSGSGWPCRAPFTPYASPRPTSRGSFSDGSIEPHETLVGYNGYPILSSCIMFWWNLYA